MNKIIIGNETEFTKAFTIDDVLGFSRISEDNNPIHVNAKYASKSIFEQQVVHGVLLISMFSKIFGTIYPGNGTIYLSQTSKFLKPAFVGDIILAKAKLISFDENKKQGLFLTECYKTPEILIFTGQAGILFPKTFTL